MLYDPIYIIIYDGTSYMRGTSVVKFIDTESRTVVAKGRWGRWSRESLWNGDRVSVLEDEKSFGDGRP